MIMTMEIKIHSPGWYENGRFYQSVSVNGMASGYRLDSTSCNNFAFAASKKAIDSVKNGLSEFSDHPSIFKKCS